VAPVMGDAGASERPIGRPWAAVRDTVRCCHRGLVLAWLTMETIDGNSGGE
jgi:hypothetical protein